MQSNIMQPIPTRASKQQVHQFAEKVALGLHYGPGQPLEPIVAALGGQIEYMATEGDECPPPSIVVSPERQFVIYLPSTTSPQRDRFSIAHELGHFFLHYPMLTQLHGDKVGMMATRHIDPDNTEQNRAEWEANWFAAAFLMPTEIFTQRHQDVRGDLAHLAALFDVSEQSASIRAKSLGIVSA